MSILENKLELFRTNVGSHMWKMNHEKSDVDIAVVYLMDSRNYLLGKRPKGKVVQNSNEDITYFELSEFIKHLLKGNVNYLWAVMSPIIISKYKTAFSELREIVATTISKSCYHSINGLSKHNIYHYIEKGDRDSLKYKKKLNVIGRTLKFGINLLTWGKFLFEKVEIDNDEELWFLKEKLDRAYGYSTLPDKPDPTRYEDYLVKWRLHKLKEDGLVR